MTVRMTQTRPRELLSTLGAATALSLLITGCGLQSKSEDVQEEAKARTNIVGNWTASCRESPLMQGRHEQLRYDMGPTNGYTFTSQIYADAGCTAKDYMIDVRGQFEFPEEIRPGANPIDFKVDDVVILPETQAAAQSANDQSLCGFTDWQAGFEKSALGADCGFMNVADGTTLHGLWEIRDNKLYLASPQLLQAANTAEERATSLDLSVAFAEE